MIKLMENIYKILESPAMAWVIVVFTEICFFILAGSCVLWLVGKIMEGILK